ncbi:MAG: transcriptional repressor, partial [Boseongicola sp. SB0664_bin_43]|nr:transcriptional repressor [Boseongicola sp. SB0664_bin_43]
MTDTILQRCEALGLRLTDQRRVVAAVLEEANDHPDVEKLYARACAVDPGISLATVYR